MAYRVMASANTFDERVLVLVIGKFKEIFGIK